MKEENSFEKRKLMKISTDKVVCNVYMDRFMDRKVRIQVAEYGGEKRSISANLDFDEMALFDADCLTGTMIKKIEKAAAEGKQYSLGYKGSPSSSNYGGKPESREITIGRMEKNGVATYFFNIIRREGLTTSTGAIIPNKQRDTSKDVKLSVPMSQDDLRTLFIYSYDCAKAFMVPYFTSLVKQVALEDKKFKENKQQE